MLKAAKFGGRNDERVENIHKRISRNAARRLKRKIQPFKDDIHIYETGNRKKGKAPKIRETVPKGTYRRSIMAWKPKGSGKFNHVYYIGARTGKKIGQKKDAWFQLIVEQDQQFIRGNNRHVGVLGDFVDTDKPKIFRQLLQAYKQEFPKRFK